MTSFLVVKLKSYLPDSYIFIKCNADSCWCFSCLSWSISPLCVQNYKFSWFFLGYISMLTCPFYLINIYIYILNIHNTLRNHQTPTVDILHLHMSNGGEPDPVAVAQLRGLWHLRGEGHCHIWLLLITWTIYEQNKNVDRCMNCHIFLNLLCWLHEAHENWDRCNS